jgi:hypothetical protein
MNELIWTACFGFCGLLILWYLWMATCRTDDFIRLVKTDQEWRRAQQERTAKAAGGAFKAALTIGKMLRR